MKNAIITGTGSYLPVREVTNFELESGLDTSDEWIFSRTGISSRHIASDNEPTSYMAFKAAEQALEAAAICADDIDLIIVATCTPEHFFPSMACHVQNALGIIKSIPAFDISAACSGFIYAMDIAKQYITTGSAKHILVIGAETMSKALDWNDRGSCILFGDGAGAVVLTASDSLGIIASAIHASHDDNQLLTFPNYATIDTASRIGMRGNEVFKLAVNYMGEIVEEVLQIAGLQKSDIDWLIPHQANIRIINAIAKKLSIPMSQVIVTLQNQGNTSAASIPLALDNAVRSKKVKRGDTLLLESFGAGMTWGALLIRY